MSRGLVKKILVVDDEPTLVATVKYNLEREGYQVVTAADGESGVAVARAERPDLVVLDLMLPGLDGFEVCRILRREMTAPILMLTAKTGEVDKVVGLELGADDYVTKPFSMRELLARVRALLRRAETAPAEAKVLIAGDLLVDLGKREASRHGQPLLLKPKEFDLLAFFLRNRARAICDEDDEVDALYDQVYRELLTYMLSDPKTIERATHLTWVAHNLERIADRVTNICERVVYLVEGKVGELNVSKY
jgi:DNA-binding response OmpR family regulator